MRRRLRARLLLRLLLLRCVWSPRVRAGAGWALRVSSLQTPSLICSISNQLVAVWCRRRASERCAGSIWARGDSGEEGERRTADSESVDRFARHSTRFTSRQARTHASRRTTRPTAFASRQRCDGPMQTMRQPAAGRWSLFAARLWSRLSAVAVLAAPRCRTAPPPAAPSQSNAMLVRACVRVSTSGWRQCECESAAHSDRAAQLQLFDLSSQPASFEFFRLTVSSQMVQGKQQFRIKYRCSNTVVVFALKQL